MTNHYSTDQPSSDNVTVIDRASRWQQTVSSVLGQLVTTPEHDGPFSGTITHGTLADLPLAEVASTQLRVVRAERFISNLTEDFYKVNFHLQGQGTLQQCGRTVWLQPGDWTIYDNSQPYELNFESDYRQLLFLVPRLQLQAKIPNIDDVIARSLSSRAGAGRILRDYLRTTLHECDQLSDDAASQLAQTLLDLLMLGLNENVEISASLPLDKSTRLTQVKQFIDEHLADNGLSIERIAAELHLSKRHLHTLFEDESLSVNRYIWQQRLAQCHQSLADPRLAGYTISEIAFSWGFNSAAHFSRQFKNAYGFSPKAHRSAAKT